MNFYSQPLNFPEQTSLFKCFKVKPRYPKTFVSFANSVCEYQTSSQGSGLKCIPVINVNVISQNSSSLFVSLLIISGSYQGFCSYQGIFLVKRRTKSPIAECIDKSCPVIFASCLGVKTFCVKIFLYLFRAYQFFRKER